MRKVLTDERHQAALQEQGYTATHPLSAAEVTYLIKEVNKLRPDDKFVPDGQGITKSTYHCSFLDTNIAYKRRARELIKEVFAPYITQHLAGYKMMNGNFHVKPPGTGRFPIHLNWHLLQDWQDTTVTMWCPLLDTDEANGTLHVVPGSHKMLPHISNPHYPDFFYGLDDLLIRHYLQPLSVKAGECVIFDDSLIHWSGQNQTATPRNAIQVICVPSDTTPVFFYPDKSDPTRFEIFEVNSEFFIYSGIEDIRQRPAQLRSLGFVPNPNRMLSEPEFVAAMRHSVATKRQQSGQ